MADRFAIQIISLGVGASNVYDSPVIPTNKILTIRKFGCADDGASNGKAATFRIQFGKVGAFTDVRVFAVNGDTLELEINKKFISDGTQFFRVTTTNSSGLTSRVAAWWFEGYDK